MATARKGVPPSPLATTAAISDWRRTRLTNGEAPLVPNLDELVGKRGLRVYREMAEGDETIRSCLALLRASIIGSGWKLEPGDPRRRVSAEAAEVIAEDLRQLPGAFTQALAEILSALTFGFSVTVTVWDLDAPRIRVKRLQTLQPDGLDFQQDAAGNIINITQQAVGGPRTLDPQRCIHFVVDGQFGNPHGTSLLRSAYRPYFHKQNWLQWLAIWGEKLAHAPVIVTMPANAQQPQVEQTLSVVDRMQARTALAVPQDWAVSLLESGKDPRQTFVTVLNQYDLMLARAVLVPDKLGYSGGQVEGGSFSLAETQKDAMFLLLEQLRRSLESCITEQLLKPASFYAYGPGVTPPRFVLLPLGEQNKLATAQAFVSLVTAGVVDPTPEDAAYARSLLGFPTEGPIAFAESVHRGASQKPSLMVDGRHTEGASQRVDFAAPLLPTKRDQHEPPVTPWREPRTMAERRVDIPGLVRLHEDGARELAQDLATGTEQLVADLKAKANRVRNPEDVERLRPSAAVMERMRARVEVALRQSYARGMESGLREVDVARTASRERN